MTFHKNHDIRCLRLTISTSLLFQLAVSPTLTDPKEMLNICRFWLLNGLLNKHWLLVCLNLPWFCDCGHFVCNVLKLVIEMDVSHLRFYAMPDFLILLPQIGNCITVVVCFHVIPVFLFNCLCCCFCVGFYLFNIS